MKVIVAGFPKTGTKTMQAALTILGYNVYDFMENFLYLEKEWHQICDVGGSTELFRQMYENVDAVTDVPGSVFWDEILKAFPDAKVILMLRANEEDWFESFRHQMNVANTLTGRVMGILSPTGRRVSKMARKINIIYVLGHPNWLTNMRPTLTALAGIGHDANEKMKVNGTICKMHYRRHNAHVLQNAPKDQLLIFNVKEGWDPLCRFLGLPTPDQPFPHKNKGGELFDEMMRNDPTVAIMIKETLLGLGVIGVLVAVLLYYGSGLMCRLWLEMWANVFE